MENHITVVLPFKFEDHQVRTMLIDGQPWFVAADVAEALEYRIAGDMTRNLDDDEKGTQIVRTLGGEQEMIVINESGLYSAILRSRKSAAKRFKKWVTAEVLPAIREHGRYVDDQGKMSTLIGQTIGTDGFHVLGSVIAGKVRALPKAVRRRATMKLWAQVHAAFNVRRAEDIPASEMASARNFIGGYSLEGEWLEAKRDESVIGFDADDAQAIHLILSHSKHLVTMKEQMHSAGRALCSPFLVEAFSHLWDIQPHLSHLSKTKASELERIHMERIGGARAALGTFA